ncbi:MAG: lysophospholipid acyltransferase family protein [Candidatus Omnitrophota bacterium]
MISKEQKKIFARNSAWFFLRIFITINGTFSLTWSYCIGKLLGTFAYLAVSRHQHIATDSLHVAFPELSLRERKKIARDFFVFMAQSGFELLYFLRHPKELDNVRIVGREHLDKALKRNKGVIMVTAHIGNFPLMSVKLAKEKYPVHFITRPMRDERAGEYLYRLRTSAGVKTIFSYPRKECISGIIKALRQNEIVIMQIDQNFGDGGVWVKFFGALAATPVGSVTLALRTNAAIVPAYIYREGKGRHCIEILPQEELIATEDSDKTILVNTITLSHIIESWIRKVPSQWGWIHRRWKSRPPERLRKMKYKIESDG